jgi:hypothetical protein
MAADLADMPVTANILLPGAATATGTVPDEMPDELRANLLDPAIMGPPIVWLASEAAGVHCRATGAEGDHPDARGSSPARRNQCRSGHPAGLPLFKGWTGGQDVLLVRSPGCPDNLNSWIRLGTGGRQRTGGSRPPATGLRESVPLPGRRDACSGAAQREGACEATEIAISSRYRTDPSGPARCDTSTVSRSRRMSPSLVEIQ